MAANFQQQHMGGGQMMSQQQQLQQRQQQQQQQQRPQPSAGQSQIQQMIFNTLNQPSSQPLRDWQQTVMIQERMSLIFNLIGNLRLIYRSSAGDNMNKILEIGMRFEKEIFDKASSKEQYKQQIHQKLEQLQEKRRESQPAMQQHINQQAQLQAQQQQAQAQAQMMMNQNGMQGQVPRGMAQQAGQQSFQHLQHQMQASLLPGQTQQIPMGMANQGGPPNMMLNQQQQLQMSMQQQQSQQNAANRQSNGQAFSDDNPKLQEHINQIMGSMSDDDKTRVRLQLRQRMGEQQYQGYASKGIDTVYLFCRQQAVQKLRSQQMLAQQQQSQNMPPGGTPMQQQRSINSALSGGQGQPPMSMGGSDFGFVGNMEALANQQRQDAMAAEQQGQPVVPMNGPRNATPQPGGMNVNEQRGVPNPNRQIQQQQQMFNAQQAQQQRLHAAQQQQQQSQLQARLNAQGKTQHIALNGQPGGMGLGPIPPQQAPIMPTLNTPLTRTPNQQMNQQESPQINPGAQFDPRFMQGRQPAPGNPMSLGGLNPAMIAGMPPEQQMRLRQLGPERLNEVVNRWQQMNNGRAQMPMQGNGQLRPGQPGAPGQFNPQNPGSQIMMPQMATQSMGSGMNPQQQQLLQQQMASLGRQPQLPPQLAGPGPNPPPQMDAMEIPMPLLHASSMPQNIPPEIKQWGQLKKWVSVNPSLGPNVSELVWGLQKRHYISLLTSKHQAHTAIQAGSNGGPGNSTASVVAPGMTAPVAHMGGQNPLPVQNRVPNFQPTQQEIDNLKRNGGPKFAAASDDILRAFLIRSKQNLMNQQRQMMINRAAQANGQQPLQHGQPQPNPNSMGQPMPNQISQSKQAQPAPEQTPASSNPPSASRPRPQSTARNPAQNTSSPAQPPKNNLKRASSDDVVEVPNPNAPQPKSTPQLAQGPTHSLQQPRMPTAQQIAAMPPEQRRRFENMVRASQARQAKAMTSMSLPDAERLQRIAKEEQEKENRLPSADIPMDEATKSEMAKKLREQIQPLNNVTKVVPKWFQLTHDEVRAREFFRARFRVMKQFRNSDMANLKDNFSITSEEVDVTRRLLTNIVSDLKNKFPEMRKPNATKPQSASTAHPAASISQPLPNGGANGAVTPLSSANLRQQQQQLDKIHQRTNSRSSHPPAAPTSSQPPFAFGAASPHGTPAYIGKNTLTQDNLHIPARKKQKQNTGQSTPGSTSSPQVTKAISPDVKRQQLQQPEPKNHPKPSLCCPETLCERHTVGFENEEALRLHTLEDHVKPLDNPLKYVQENLAALAGLDNQGHAKQPVTRPSQEAGNAPTSAKMIPSGSRQGLTPNMKAENASAAGTPMMRQVSMNRQGSSAGHKPQAQVKSSASVKSETQSIQKGSLRQEEQPRPQDVAPVDPWASSTVDPQELAQFFHPFATGAEGAISNIDTYRSITPNDTPESSKDGVSEPNSDISEGVALDISVDFLDDKWMPFGPGDTDTMVDLNSFNFSDEEDLTMFGNEPQTDVNFQSWDDMVDMSGLDKLDPFDTSLYSMQAS